VVVVVVRKRNLSLHLSQPLKKAVEMVALIDLAQMVF
jgi:hypothetical protein